MFDSGSKRPTRPPLPKSGNAKYGRASSAKGSRYGAMHTNNSSKYINTDQKRNQIETHGGQTNILAYSLNKNMKNLKMSTKDKRQRPKTANRA